MWERRRDRVVFTKCRQCGSRKLDKAPGTVQLAPDKVGHIIRVDCRACGWKAVE